MDFDSPDVEKDFPGLYASESGKRSNESDFSDEAHDKVSKKDLLIGKRKEKKEAKKYATLEGESSPEEDTEVKSPSKVKKSKAFKFPSTKKEKREKSREKECKEKEAEKEKEKKKEEKTEKDKDKKKENEKDKDKKKEAKVKIKSKEKKKLKHTEDGSDIAEEQPVFGVPLAVSVERSRCHDGVEIPLVVRDCIDHIQEVGLNCEGLYKVSGKSKVQTLRRLYNQRESVNLADYDLPAATSLLKTFLRELPEPLLTASLLPRFEEAAAIKDTAARGTQLKAIVDCLPLCNRHLLAWLIKHFDFVTAHEKSNKINGQAIAAVMSPVIQASQRLITALLCHCEDLFPDCELNKYVPPLSCASPSLPDSREAIVEELRKQESLLGQLHSEMRSGLCSKSREERLWEAQRIVTQLKRKLRSLERTTETTQRSLEEPDGGRAEEELNLTLQQTPLPPLPTLLQPSVTATLPAPPQQAVVQESAERPDLSAISADSLEIQAAEKSWLAKQEELALTFETEELTNLAKYLQALIENEKAEVALLQSNVRALGGVPQRMYLWEESADDIEAEGLTNAEKETLLLQKEQRTLAASLIEERLACVDLKVQIRLAQAYQS